jgi:hypothetical protein
MFEGSRSTARKGKQTAISLICANGEQGSAGLRNNISLSLDWSLVQLFRPRNLMASKRLQDKLPSLAHLEQLYRSSFLQFCAAYDDKNS